MVEVDLSIIFAGLSIAASIVYYTSIIRNQNMTRQKEQVQLRIQSADQDYHRAWTNVMFKRPSNNEEWHQIYDPIKDPELFADMIFIRTRYQSLGVMLKEKVIEPDLLYKIYTPSSILFTWEHYRENVLARRVETNDPNQLSEFEYLYEETKKRYPDITPFTRH